MTPPDLTPLIAFTRQLGRTAPTIWRWRQNGMLDGIINIAGRPYITAEGVEKFHQRARAGEFAKPDHAPRKIATNGGEK